MFEASIQGFIQGVTEFLPVSSSGHLVLATHLFRFQDLDPAYNVFVQGGTIISLIAYYLPKKSTLGLTQQKVLLLILASLPAGIVGLLLEDKIDTLFGSLQGLALGFLLTTASVAVTRFAKPFRDSMTLRDALTIGLAQAVAILPSVSRSGATIGTALMLGIRPATAFDFSFLMSIPVMSGATMLSLRHIVWESGRLSSYLTGFAIAAVTGYMSLVVLARIMKQGKFYVFAPYTLLLAALSMLLY